MRDGILRQFSFTVTDGLATALRSPLAALAPLGGPSLPNA